MKKQNEKKYRHGEEYGSARWGTAKDIAPYEDPVFSNNVILTATERLTMNNRPKDPATARNKNVLIIGGSGSGKTRFWLKPNLLQMHSSYVMTDPKAIRPCDTEVEELHDGGDGFGFRTIRERGEADMKNRRKSPPYMSDYRGMMSNRESPTVS